VAAEAAANNSGAAQLRELVDRYSLPAVQAYMRHIQDAAERKMRWALSSIPDGVYRRTDHLDQGSPICVEITIAGNSATVDFTGTGPVILPPAPAADGTGGDRKNAGTSAGRL
jgi:5-oxoprolinase (ATP-hydrolysing)